jgi:tetratricopeptide (TPR) repeat protein
MDLEYKINKAEKLFNENEYDKSNQLYKEVLRERPYNLQALINISDNLIRQNKSLEAEPYALDAYLLYKDVDDMTVANYSFVLFEKNELDLAIAVCEDACMRGSQNSLVIQNLGYYYMYKNMYSKALQCYNRSIALNKDNPIAYCKRGILRYFVLNDNGGIADLLKAHHLKDPEATEILQIIAIHRKKRLLKYSNME